VSFDIGLGSSSIRIIELGLLIIIGEQTQEEPVFLKMKF